MKQILITIVGAAISLSTLASAGSNPIENGLVFFEMTTFADVDRTTENGQYFELQVVDPIFVPIGETVIVPGATPGINAFQLSSSLQTNGGVREIIFDMRTIDGLFPGFYEVIQGGGSPTNYVNWPGVPNPDRWWGHSWSIGIDTVDVQQTATGEFSFAQIKYSPFGSPNTLRWFCVNPVCEWPVGRDLLIGPLSSYRPAIGSGPFSNGSEGNTHGYRYIISYPIDEGEPCNTADIAAPFGVLDLADIDRFVGGFTSNGEIADLNRDDLYDLADIGLFVNGFVNGCP